MRKLVRLMEEYHVRVTFTLRQLRHVSEDRGRSVVSEHVADSHETQLAGLLRVHLQEGLENLWGRRASVKRANRR